MTITLPRAAPRSTATRSYGQATILMRRGSGLAPADAAEVTPYLAGTTTPYPGPLYGDPDTLTPLVFPVATGSDGVVALWADAPGRLELQASHPSLGTGRVLLDLEPPPEDAPAPVDAYTKAESDARFLGAMGDVHDVRSYGATGDGTTDDTAAVQAACDAAAAGGAAVFFPAGRYKVTTVSLAHGFRLRGTHTLGATDEFGVAGSTLVGTAGAPILLLPTDANQGTATSVGGAVERLRFEGGEDHIRADNGAALGLQLRCLTFVNPSHAGIALRGFCQEVVADRLDFYGGPYGVYSAGVGTHGGAAIMDKCFWAGCYFTGQTVNGVYLDLEIGTHVSWRDVRLVRAGGSGMVVDGGASGWLFESVSSEGNGWADKDGPPPTTGTIAAGGTALTVASAVGIGVGDVLTVAGAGTWGWDLRATVGAVAGSVVTVSPAAGTAVADADVTPYASCDLEFRNTSSSSAALTFVDVVVGEAVGQGRLRYAIDLAGCAGAAWFVGGAVAGTRPIHDPNNLLSAPHLGPNVSLRRPDNFLSEQFLAASSGRHPSLPRSQVVSPAGRDYVVGLVDSNQNGSGTHGRFEVRVFDGARTPVLRLDPDNRRLGSTVGFAPGRIDPATGATYDGGARLFRGSAPPVAGDWSAGDVVLNEATADGQALGWGCVSGGTPGVWQAMPAYGGGGGLDEATADLRYLQLVGGLLTGNLTLAGPLAHRSLAISNGSGANRQLLFQTDGLDRWLFQGASADPETGSNAGSNFNLFRCDDAGTVQFPAVLSLTRATGALSLGGATTVGGALTSTGDVTVSKTTPVLNLKETADTFARLSLQSNGLFWGPGTGGADTQLTRSAAGDLRTTASLYPTTNNARSLGASTLQWSNLRVGFVALSGDGTSNPVVAGGGAVRLRNGATGNLAWRNAANTADLTLGVDASDRLALAVGATSLTTSATAGGATALPATPTGYLTVVLNSSTVKIPYYS